MTVHDIQDGSHLGAVVDEHDVVFIDFWSPWCQPCIEFAPILDRVAENHDGLFFCRVNTNDHEALKRQFEVESIPTIVAIRDHTIVAVQSGMLSEEALESLVEQVLNLDMRNVLDQSGS